MEVRQISEDRKTNSQTEEKPPPIPAQPPDLTQIPSDVLENAIRQYTRMPRNQEPGRFGTLDGLLGGAILLALVVFLVNQAHDDPVVLIPLSGLVSALALVAARKTRPFVAAGFLGLAFLVGFAFANITIGCVLAAALAAGLAHAVHPWRHGRRQGDRRLQDDDHFFLGSLFFWFALATILSVVALAGSKETLGTLGGLPAETAKEFLKSLENADEYFQANEATGLLVWMREHPITFLLAIILPAHAFIAFVAIRWARGWLEWIHPIEDTMILFRVDTRYSLILVLSLALFLLDPYVSGASLGSIAIPLLAWFSVASCMAGFACVIFTIATLRAAKRFLAAWIALAALALAIFAIELLVIIGMIDIWFDIRKLTPKRGEM